jgi:2,4-dienoyl-CoA reductase-like NADH-dependent reductase (Old Yellow Enzyme family)
MDLFSSFNIKGKSIKNRIVMPPMVCFGWSDNDGYVTDEHVNHYEKRALGGTGLIVIEATCVNKNGRLDDTQIGLWDDTQIDGFKRIADACHKHGAVILVQIHHAGSKTPASVTDTPVSPSEAELRMAGYQRNFQ